MAAGRIAVPNIIPLQPPSTDASLRNCLTSDTKIELKSDTPDTDVYFTLDGRIPEPFATLGTAKWTQLYREPFCLPPGKMTIKAVAVERRTGKESLMITKRYQVDSNSLLTSNYDAASLDDAKSVASQYSNKSRMTNSSTTRKLRAGIPARPSSVASSIRSMQKRPPSRSILTSSQVMSRAWASSLICPACCAPRLQSKNSKFCPECGAKYPGLRPTVTRLSGSVLTRGQMRRCTKCQTLIPPNSGKCVVCMDRISDSDARPQMTTNQPEQNIASTAKYKLQCILCSELNSPSATSCSVCENGLAFAKRVPVKADVPIKLMNQMNGTSDTVKCPTCKTANRQNSKFCASCGKTLNSTAPATCAQCRNRLDVGMLFCTNCGALASGAHFMPPTSTVSRSLLGERNSHETSKSTKYDGIEAVLQQNKVDAGNQQEYNGTSGKKPIAYVSAINPIAQPLSPGGGYWRQQLDHIASHLKAYAQSNKGFQVDVADYRIGKIIDAIVEIGADGVFSLRVDFELPDQNNLRPSSIYVKTTASRDDQRRRRSVSSNRSADRASARESVISSTRSRSSSAGRPSSRPSRPSSQRSASRPQSAKTKTEPSASSNDLLKELQMPDQDGDQVKRLLDGGADPATIDQHGMPLLAIAAKCNFVDAIGVLLLAGAKINAKHPPIGNTALHEAAQLGSNGKTMIQELLRNGADAQIENKRGETPQAIALKYKHAEIADLLAAHVGQKILRKGFK
uniref:Double zinc ribbon and ankyrin repeat-containing protein 1 n=1 Tax=Plectus sambesii TaxID=2011161 RepID=A0A914W8E5_9BILA